MSYAAQNLVVSKWDQQRSHVYLGIPPIAFHSQRREVLL